MDKAIVSIVYGDNATYYNGSKFSILSFLSQLPQSHWPKVYILTEQPDRFSGFPFEVMGLTCDQKKEWTCDGRYHFRIKNRGLKFVLENADSDIGKFLFFDADTHFKTTSNTLFELVGENEALLFYPETNINDAPSNSEYGKLKGKKIPTSTGIDYELQTSSTMWNSGVIGVSRSMLPNIEYADDLILGMMDIDCRAHTIEQFALSEALVKDFNLNAAREYVNDYSTSGQKAWARIVLERFFEEHGNKPFEEQVRLAKDVSFKRPLAEVVRGHIYKKKKKLRKLFGLKEE
ncbi:hypothetical protein [Vibrio genomosp. F10]|uniref:hypothetical protein n=1 Tax=Vibrio genomosp. F10 TaxID=723171 RepID=UPI00084C661F|nr:hypothetical protein [Vibrio genomosp. F10]OEF01137.1 hypothetical protein A1QK_01810 [Vibrio genomosp. F10 str. 9ZD137]